MDQTVIKSTTMAITDLLRLVKHGDSKLWIDYDKEVDVLYVNFDKPQKADNAFQDDNGIIRRMRRNKLVGITILDASRFISPKN